MRTMAHRQPGTLVSFRGREWIVLPSDNPDLTLLKPLGGSDDEITGVYLPLNIPQDAIRDATFRIPQVGDLNDFETGKLLFEATRLSFRHASGPFRCMGKLSFRPRSYQIIPLVMALKQDFTRLFIADDVGIGKTIEALIILKELLERGEIKRFAVICLPHLCDQWQEELKDKLDIHAEIIRSSTVASLDRKLPDDRSVFHHIPYQVISIDYIKSEKRRDIFLLDCPELIIVDEVHTCARPAGTKSVTQQQRYHLLHDIAKKEDHHLIVLTATPHSGKDEEFKSLLGFMDPKFQVLDLTTISQREKEQIANHYIQRKRENIKHWLREDTPFPERIVREWAYTLSESYMEFYHNVLGFAREMTRTGDTTTRGKYRYWAALALLRGVMSSPAAGLEMLRKKEAGKAPDEDMLEPEDAQNPEIESLESGYDVTNTVLIENSNLTGREKTKLSQLGDEIRQLFGPGRDYKVNEALKVIKSWLKDPEKIHPIVFCRYIATANYVSEVFKSELPGDVEVQVITSELADEQRKEKIEEIGQHPRRVLIATDCLSEGINLQKYFTAVLHYDLPWNPNRLEQREGRVDRYGQEAPKVHAYLLYGKDNPIDAIVLQVLIKKVRDIQRDIGVSLPIGDENYTIMETVLKEVLMNENVASTQGRQMRIDFGSSADLTTTEAVISRELELAKEKAVQLRNIFAHTSIKPEEIEPSLKEVDEAIGDNQVVENFVKNAVIHLGGHIQRHGQGYKMDIFNLPPFLKIFFKNRDTVYVSFDSPTPAGFIYIGRNHRFVEQLCHLMIKLAFEPDQRYKAISRAAVVQTEEVLHRTVIIQFRVRNVVKESGTRRKYIAEEMYLWGYSGTPQSRILTYNEARELLSTAVSSGNISTERQKDEFTREMSDFGAKEKELIAITEERAVNLVEAHGRFRKLVGGRQYEAVYPVLPPDIMGMYILIPKPKSFI
ncbi:MAG TPA: helicase-related protein [Bacteroidales bacterium]|nr:helicase-related protein [Bacteroidales bacterium]